MLGDRGDDRRSGRVAGCQRVVGIDALEQDLVIPLTY
jgi:hypothetical protein